MTREETLKEIERSGWEAFHEHVEYLRKFLSPGYKGCELTEESKRHDIQEYEAFYRFAERVTVDIPREKREYEARIRKMAEGREKFTHAGAEAIERLKQNEKKN